MTVTGHRSTDGVRAYKRMCEELYKDVSHVLQASVPKKLKSEESEKENALPLTAAQETKQTTMPFAPPHVPGEPGSSVCNTSSSLPVVNFTGCSSIVINYKL